MQEQPENIDIKPEHIANLSTPKTFEGGHNYAGTFYTYTAPTGNCQIFSIAQFNSLLVNLATNRHNTSKGRLLPDKTLNTKYYNDDNSFKYNICKKSLFKVLHKVVYNTGNKAIMLLDINDLKSYISAIDEIFKDQIITKQPYNSTNGSKMVLYLIKTETIRNYKDEI